MTAENAQNLRIACLQMRSVGQVEANVRAFETMVRDAASQGARYIQSPEMTGIVQRKRSELFTEIKSCEADPLLLAAARLSADLKIWLHIGSTAISLENEFAANRAVLFSPQGIQAAVYDKIHMFDVDLDHGESWRESNVYQPGDCSIVVDSGEFMLGISVCYDLRFPSLFQNQAKAGAQILTCPAAFTRQTGEAHWHTLLRARAIENGAFMVAAAQGGIHEDGRETYGHSLVVNPWGEIIAEVPHDEPAVLIADLDLTQVNSARNKVPNLSNDRMFTQELVDARPAGLAEEVA